MSTFKLAIVGDNDPLTDDPFFAWLSLPDNNPRGKNYMDVKTAYLESLGFVLGTDKLSERDLKVLGHVLEQWHRVTPRHSPMRLADAFPGAGDYWVTFSDGSSGNHSISAELESAIENAGWIYPVDPSTTYFKVMGGRLIAHYQGILGSRYICNLEGVTK